MSDSTSFLMDRATRFGIMIGLVVLMFVPLIFIGIVIEERAGYQAEALEEVGSQWGGRQVAVGPVLVVPVDVLVTDEKKEGDRTVTTTRTETAEPLILLPEKLAVTGTLKSEIRSRGIFEVPVYATEFRYAFGFDRARLDGVLAEKETARWDKARIELHVSNTRALRSEMVLKAGEAPLALEPGSYLPRTSGVHAAVTRETAIGELTLTFTLNGSERLFFAPAGRQTDVGLKGDWPHPSFTGAFLPDGREVTEAGFAADWSIPHLARDLPQVVRGASELSQIDASTFGLDLYNPVDFYQKVSRAAKYGILFIALTFLTIFLMEGLSRVPVHPAQYVLIGVAQCVFFLLLLSFAEQIGFSWAYLVAGLATILLLGFYALAALKLGRRAGVLVSVLILLYATLYLILQSTDFAMLAGSILAFLAVALTMYLTRNEKWFAERGPAEPGPAPAAPPAAA